MSRRYKGRITEWRDDRGFGFVTPMEGRDTVFIHIKSFASRARRPAGNELVTYARNRWRTPEAHLHLLALIGGWPGALLAQRVLRHKSSKKPFRTVFWATVVVNCAVLVWVVCDPDALERWIAVR